MTRLTEKLLQFLRIGRQVETHSPTRGRKATTHVILLDGTASSLEPGEETNIGRIYRLLREQPAAAHLSLYYEAGVQWHMWRDTADVAMGRGINRQIRRAYGWLAGRYRPGDRIFLFGYSRGAYAVRSLAGLIDQVGLLRSDQATERNVQLAYRYYQRGGTSDFIPVFCRKFCHAAADQLFVVRNYTSVLAAAGHRYSASCAGTSTRTETPRPGVAATSKRASGPK